MDDGCRLNSQLYKLSIKQKNRDKLLIQYPILFNPVRNFN